MLAAAVQLHSTPDRDRNLEAADRLTRAAARAGAELVVLPEKWPVLGTPEQTIAAAEAYDGPTHAWASGIASELGIDLVAGSFSERSGGERGSNTSVHVGPDGETKAAYRKIHMFDVEVGGKVYKESEREAPGEEIVVSETAAGTGLGLTICYDLRFPALYRALALAGAEVMTIPAAFTRPTGAAHWEILMRARAIETGAFVLAPAQGGFHEDGRGTWGHSIVVGPWGEVIASLDHDEPGVLIADLDLTAAAKARKAIPALANARAFTGP